MQRDSILQMYYHFVWTTKGRLPVISERLQRPVFDYISANCKELDVLVHALGGTSDHIHLARSLPTRLSVSEFMNKIKGSFSFYINHFGGNHSHFAWQRG